MSITSSVKILLPPPFGQVFFGILEAWINGGKLVRRIVLFSTAIAVPGFIAAYAASRGFIPQGLFFPFMVTGGLATASLLVVAAYQETIERSADSAKIEILEQQARDNPDQPLAAWDLARIKLENYLDRNLSQVSWIYYLVLLVMLVGFSLVIFGVYKIYEDPSKFTPGIMSAVSGIVVQFIGATFLLIYRSTMVQAQNYVEVLERINAVGMSIQILESIEGDDPAARNSARAGLATDLLRMYGPSVKRSKREAGASRTRRQRPRADRA